MEFPVIGAWSAGPRPPAFRPDEILEALQSVREPVGVLRDGSGRVGVSRGGQIAAEGHQLLGVLPALWPEWLGDRSFCEVHRLRFPYVAGAMANGIATTRLVIAMARAGMLGFFGAAGLSPRRVEQAVDELVAELGVDGPSWGVNLIHSPNEEATEAAVAELLLRKGVRRIEASAYMGLTPHVVRVSAAGLRLDASGRIVRDTHVFAKISRPEVAQRFMAPAPAAMLDQLVAKGWITAEQAKLAAKVPVAEDITVESDSGGHPDNRPLGSLFPVITALRDRIAQEQGYTRPIRVGAAGGLGSPLSVASAFGLGAAYVLTGSVNQACIESGLSEEGRKMLAQAGIADVVMAPAADMFEMGVQVQVLRRGTFFSQRGHLLHEIYRDHARWEDVPADVRAKVEKDVFRTSFDEIWAETRRFWEGRDARELARAESDLKHRMALCFRWYLGLSSRWAIAGQADRRLDYQVWCGPAMGAFNDWVKGSFLEAPERREAVQVALNLLEGAAVLTRAQQLRTYGVPVPPAAFAFRPRPLS